MVDVPSSLSPTRFDACYAGYFWPRSFQFAAQYPTVRNPTKDFFESLRLGEKKWKKAASKGFFCGLYRRPDNHHK